MLNDKLLPVGDMKHLATNVEIEDDEIVLSGESVFNGYLGDIVGGYSKVDGINTYKTGEDNGEVDARDGEDKPLNVNEDGLGDGRDDGSG